MADASGLIYHQPGGGVWALGEVGVGLAFEEVAAVPGARCDTDRLVGVGEGHVEVLVGMLAGLVSDIQGVVVQGVGLGRVPY